MKTEIWPSRGASCAGKSVLFGMTRAQVHESLGAPTAVDESRELFEKCGVFVEYNDLGVVIALEFARDLAGSVWCRDRDVFALSAKDLADWLQSVTQEGQWDKRLRSRSLGLAVYAPWLIGDDPDPRDEPAEGVLAFAPSYYD